MSDTALNRFLAFGSDAARIAFTPSPPVPASGPDPLYLWFTDDTLTLYAYDFGASDWVGFTSGSGMTNPMTWLGDMITAGSGGIPIRLGIGNTADVLTVVAGVPAWAPSAGGGGSSVRQVTGTTDTLVSADADNIVTFSSGSGAIVTIPDNGAEPMAVGSTIKLIQLSVGKVKIVPDGGVTLTAFNNADLLAGLGAMAELVQVAADEWVLDGTTRVAGSATGGTVTTDGAYTIHTFTSSDSLVVTGTLTAEILIVAGGGGAAAGGGGAGGLIHVAAEVLTNDTFAVVIGAGGAGTVTNVGVVQGTSGVNTTAFGYSAVGGGGGGNTGNSGHQTGLNGGSGGGGGIWSAAECFGGSGTAGQGNDGGSNGSQLSPPYVSGGGGGAGAVGQDAPSGSQSGAGGVGLEFDISGTPTFYAGGGGGYSYSTGSTGGAGGTGGGGTGASGGGSAGTANSGGGGGGSSVGVTGGAGGSGVVIVRYLTS